MVKLAKVFLLICIFSFCITGCTPKNISSTEKQYSEINVMSSKDNYVDVYSLKDKQLFKIESVTNLSDVVYSYEDGIYIYLVNVTPGQNFYQNKIKIETKKDVKMVNNFYNAMDIKISPKGEKIAYRSFLKDSYESAEGLTIYNIAKNKNMRIRTSVLVSGNLYNWLNKDEIVYYGVSTESKECDKLYKYNFDTNTEEVYIDNIKDFCTFFTLVKNKGALCLEESGIENRLVFNELESKNRTLITNSISNIYYALYNEKSNAVYFVGLEKNEERCALFKVSIDDLTLTRLTYDFPKEVDRYGGLIKDSSGNVYFCGVNNSNNANNQVYMLNISDKSINLITGQKGRYYLGGNNK